jgi:hypothetical protein
VAPGPYDELLDRNPVTFDCPEMFRDLMLDVPPDDRPEPMQALLDSLDD